MKLFKKALVATAIMGACGAQAATISSTPFKLSAEGAELGVSPVAKTVSFDVVVDKEHPSASTITLSFDKNVDLTADLDCAGAVTQSVGGGAAYCGDIGFNYGTGSFTFDNVVVTDGDRTKGETDSISFQVNLGNPLTANSAFRVILGDHSAETGATPSTGVSEEAVLVFGESKIGYSSAKADKTPIETGEGVIATEVSQFDFDVTTPLDGIIERVEQDQWVYTGSTGGLTVDQLAYSISNDETLGLALTDVSATVTFAGNFTDVDLFSSVTTSVTSASIVLADEEIDVNYASGALEDNVNPTYGTTASALTKEIIDFVNGSAIIPATGDVTATATVTGFSNTGVNLPTGGYVFKNNVDAGEWMLDATIINVPYFPVNYPETDSSVHIANEGSSDADVIVTAIDNNGVEHGPLDLGFDAPAHTVTKVSKQHIIDLFGLGTAPTKLSVTFNIDADERNVSAYSFTQNGKGRSEVSNSQLKGK
ncbi:glycoprotein X precursor [Pseudoalteromonas sp. SW0106-04]|uniref:hypothetical protein n=1 Tax=Pseudoalteromonas sp. SW0106-04 TaxID=1702169 RepID=UPI0006B64EB3|nr:hypothetical protein [Pseudoalteromonas sp. SW0106-04]GAP74598.1 glycoprotein X precursor [Pseudoalteromonas sp. SW0106-04]